MNKRKGPAVQGLRAQIDRELYKKYLKEELFSKPIYFEENSVEDLLIENRDGKLYCNGIILNNGKKIRSKTTIVTTGTFLNGLILIGKEQISAGRMGDKASIGLSDTFKRLNFKMGRLKTGTPPRILKDTIDYDEMEIVKPDENPEPFSYLNDRVRIEPNEQIQNYITYTDDKIVDLVKSNLDSSSYIRQEARGVRYCPSLEAKILKFSSNFHQVWIEQESFDSNIVYPNGLTTGFPFDYQQKIVNSIKGLKRAKLARPGYSIEYDFIDPTQLFPTLETKNVNNLYLAGQINGTTGYEEAAAQGILAGINAAGKTQDKPNFFISRTEAFIGVIVDDLTSNGVTEPYRMMTARSEYRLSLRPDNGDKRLTEKGFKYGCVSQKRYEKYLDTVQKMELIKDEFNEMNFKINEWQEFLKLIGVKLNSNQPTMRRNGTNLLERYNYIKAIHLKKISEQILQNNKLKNLDDRLFERVEIECRYNRLTIIQDQEIKEFKKEENLELSKDLDYSDPSLCLNKESIEILNQNRPFNVSFLSNFLNFINYLIVNDFLNYFISFRSLLQLNYLEYLNKQSLS